MAELLDPDCGMCLSLQSNTCLILETPWFKVFPHLDLATGGSDQKYLGRSVIIPKIHRPSLAALSPQFPEAILEYFQVQQVLWKAISKAFGADYPNWMEMNNYAYREAKPNPHTHVHLFPRYRSEVHFAGLTFIDSKFGSFISREQIIVPPEMRLAIAEEVKNHIEW